MGSSIDATFFFPPFAVDTFEACHQYLLLHQESVHQLSIAEKSLIPAGKDTFFLTGYCFICKRKSRLLVDYSYSYLDSGVLMPNWKERLVCQRCQFNSRMRSSFHIFLKEVKPVVDSKIYITEQQTSFYALMKKSYPAVTGSEFLNNMIPNGETDSNGIRNEDLTKLSFSDGMFDYILSFDCFEHIQAYKIAFAECYRCLKSSGVLFFTVPFNKDECKNLVRAGIDETGRVIHYLPPEYHGNPLNAEGSLCFYFFGWELLEEVKAVGFRDVKALLYWSGEYGYLGGLNVKFLAKK